MTTSSPPLSLNISERQTSLTNTIVDHLARRDRRFARSALHCSFRLYKLAKAAGASEDALARIWQHHLNIQEIHAPHTVIDRKEIA